MERTASRRTSFTIRNIRLTALFTPEDVIHNTSASTAAEVVRQLLEHLALQYGIGNINMATKEVMDSLEKDDVYPHAGLAVPYGRLERVTDPLVAIATSENGIMFGEQTVYLVVVVLSPIDMPGAYRQILHGVGKACDAHGSALKVAGLKSPLAVWQYFDSGGHRLPDHLQACHIMSAVDVHLDADDSLAAAIDLFLKHRVSELPVLTPGREIIGVVTTRRLVRICMPEYLMWIEDMTPFLNLEPLAEIIRNESSTWLRDIMTTNFAHVTENSPVILAMKEIGRRETDNAYVMRGRKLAGIINLHEFLGYVLR